jgi:TnpA family transposase
MAASRNWQTTIKAKISLGNPRQNRPAGAVFFNRLGELRDRTYENQRYRASGLNMVVAAIMLGDPQFG